ncbi:MAG: (E)-4-hydroxy-3-methylbut-2-enyl-diphosphate synthase [bacterium]|nr:(E)-4-hydroxy-3-methylbut-2-enyl-diphosphate synthase [bacterium]
MLNRENSRTREVTAGSVVIGGQNPIALQSMCATRTTDIEATLRQIHLLQDAGADLIRIAIDSKKDVEALQEIRKETTANLVVDLQENYRLAADVAPLIQKFRYNPGHLHHHEKSKSVAEKVKFLVEVAGAHNLAMRIGVNFGSLDPEQKGEETDSREAALNSARQHCQMVEGLGFKNFVVSLKSSDPRAVVEINRRFSEMCPEIPLHLGVTEAGLLPDGAIKTRIAFEQLLSSGIGDTVRVSLTVPDNQKDQEIIVAREIVEDVAAGRFRSVPEFLDRKFNVISCPSCSRVENHAFVELAQEVKRVTEKYGESHKLTIAVMGCRVNGPGETDEADIGLWCAPNHVNLKRGHESLGAFKYDEVIARMLAEVESIIASRGEG